MLEVIKKANRVLLSDGRGNCFMEFQFHYEKNGLVAFSFDIEDFQEVFVDNYNSGQVSVSYFNGMSMIKSFDFPDEGLTSEDEIEYLYLLSEILAFEIINNLPS